MSGRCLTDTPDTRAWASLWTAATPSFQKGEVVLTAPNIWSSRTFAGYQLDRPQIPAPPARRRSAFTSSNGPAAWHCRLRMPEASISCGQDRRGGRDKAPLVLFHDFMLRRIGAHRIIAIEPVPERLEHARRMGADDVIDVTGQRATDAVLDLTNGEGADLVIEAVGSIDTLNQSLKTGEAPWDASPSLVCRPLWSACHSTGTHSSDRGSTYTPSSARRMNPACPHSNSPWTSSRRARLIWSLS